MPSSLSSKARLLAVVAAVAGLGACRGPCQKVCVNLATYAEECGFSVPDSDLDACLDGQKDASSDENGVCREYGDPEVIRNEWSCDDLAAYWDGSGGDATE